MTEKSTIRLSDLCDLVSEQVNPREIKPETTYVGLAHMKTGRFVRTEKGQASDVRSSKSAFKPGDILYGKLRPYLDKAALVQDKGICTTDVLVLRHKEGVDPRFLISVVHSPDFIEYAIAGTTGVQHPRTSWSHIREFAIPKGTLDEQERIAGMLWLVHEGIAASETLIKVGNDLKRAAMQKLFAHGLRGEVQKHTEIGPLPESWGVEPLGNHFEIVQGLSLKGNLATDGTGVPFLRTSNVYWGRIDLSKISRMNVETTAIRDLQSGDLLVCEGGEIGRAAIWSDEIEHCTYQNHVYRLRPTANGKADPKFVMRWLEEGFCHRQVYEGAGNKTTIPNLSRSRLSELRIPIATLDEQKEIVAILDAIDRKIDLHHKKRAVLTDLFKTLLHQLMTGKLQVRDLDLLVLSDAKAESPPTNNENATTNEVRT